MKVWLDDERPAPDGWAHVATPTAMVDLLSTRQVEEISLRLDTAPEQAGLTIALWLKNTWKADPTFPIPEVTVRDLDVDSWEHMNSPMIDQFGLLNMLVIGYHMPAIFAANLKECPTLLECINNPPHWPRLK